MLTHHLVINNVGTIAQALSAKGNLYYDKVAAEKLQAAQVSIISLANCGARLGVGQSASGFNSFIWIVYWTPIVIPWLPSAGASADFVKSRLAGHRSYLLSVVSLLFIISQVVGSQIEDVNHLWRASLLLGLGHGGIFGLLPTVRPIVSSISTVFDH